MFCYDQQVGYLECPTIQPGKSVWINVSDTCLIKVVPVGLTVQSMPLASLWETTLTATGEVYGSYVNVATSIIGGNDALENTVLTPPDPPEYTTNIKLYRLDPISGTPVLPAFYKDIRLFSTSPDTQRWVMQVDPNGNDPFTSRTTTIGWDKTTLANGLGYHNWMIADGIVAKGIGALRVSDMRTINSFDVTGTSEQFFTIIYAYENIPVAVEDKEDIEQRIPNKFALHQNYPNPFNASTQINYDLPEATKVTIKIFNINGQLVRTLVDGLVPAGYHIVIWDGRDSSGMDLSSGVYIYKLNAGSFHQEQRMVLVR